MAEGTAGELGEVLARIDERFDRSEEKNAERFARVDERFDEWLERIDERMARAEEKVDERFAVVTDTLGRAEEKGDERFAEANRHHREITRRFDVVDRQSERANDRLDALVRTMVTAIVSLTCGMLAGFGAILVLIATQL